MKKATASELPVDQNYNPDQSQFSEISPDNIPQFLQALDEHRLQMEREGRYVEAELAHNRINELKHQEYARQQEELIFMHESQKVECEQAHIRQYQQFNEHWDQELALAQQTDQEEIAATEEKHTQCLEQNRVKLEAQLMQKFKGSTDLLNMRKQQEHMARQKNYGEAHQIQQQANAVEEKERAKYADDVQKIINASEANMMMRQQKEMQALKKKLESKMNERLKIREQEHNKILQRYQNVKKEIENQQRIEQQKRERQYKVSQRPQTAQSSRSTMSMSKMQSQSKLGGTQTSTMRSKPASKPSHY